MSKISVTLSRMNMLRITLIPLWESGTEGALYFPGSKKQDHNDHQRQDQRNE